MRKFFAILLAALLVLSLTATAFAEDAGAGGKITVTNAVDGIEYNAYKILDIEYNDETDAYVYLAVDEWVDFITDHDGFFTYDTDTGIVGLAEEEDLTETAAEIAAAALAYAVANEIEPLATETAADGEAVLEVGDLGYYVVDSSLGALCALDSTLKTVDILEKNSEPDIEKEAEEVTIAIGGTVHYTVTVTVGKGAQNYVVKDKMGDGLDFAGIDSVTVGEDDFDDYELDTSDDDYTFILTLDNDAVAALDDGDEIVIEYSANVTADAYEVVENDASLDFGDESTVEAEPVEVDLYEFSIIKTDENEVKLDGATFKLYTGYDAETDTLSGQVELIYDENEDHPGYRPIVDDEEADEVIDVADGEVLVYGLAAGTYYLKEESSPEGYNRDKTVNTIVLGDGEDAVTEITVINKSGAELPSTGGIGTTIFYVAGGILVVAAGVLLITKKRTEE